jgi:hypothetical protein
VICLTCTTTSPWRLGDGHAEPSDFVERNANALVHARSLKKIVYAEDTGGQEHCQVGAATLWWADVFQWLEETYR